MSVAVLGLDIGGANLKAVHTDGLVRSRRFALWKEPAALADRLRSLCGEFPGSDRVAVTMTGELCDCFATRREGVRHILDAVAAVVPPNVVSVFRTDGRFADWDEAYADPLSVAAANWLALAAFVGRYAPTGSALMVDIGSTTSDLIPLRDGAPVPTGRTDADRLASGELIYTGVRRTPACALLGGGGAAEFFATTLDVYLLLQLIPEDGADTDTADGRPATNPHAHARLARMLCGDAESVPRVKAVGLAKRLSRLQQHLLDAAARRISAKHGPPETLIIGGSGEFLARRTFAWHDGATVSLSEQLGPERSAAACAHAVAVLLQEQS
jgi:probable H4MPT-linked C1 transfer pathway protein